MVMYSKRGYGEKRMKVEGRRREIALLTSLSLVLFHFLFYYYYYFGSTTFKNKILGDYFLFAVSNYFVISIYTHCIDIMSEIL